MHFANRNDGRRSAGPTSRRQHGDRAPWLQGKGVGRTARPAVAPYQRRTEEPRDERNVPFYQTNPPFLRDFFDASAYICMCCNRKSGVFSVGSFWKTNPPEGCFWGRFHRKLGSFFGRRSHLVGSRDGNVLPRSQV